MNWLDLVGWAGSAVLVLPVLAVFLVLGVLAAGLGGRAGQVEQRLFRYALEERQPRESRQVHGVLRFQLRADRRPCGYHRP